MFARLSAKAMWVAGLAAMVFFGVGLIGLAIATMLAAKYGVAGGYLIAGAILLLIPILWILVLLVSRPPRRTEQKNDFATSLFTSLARETPWAAVVGAGLMGIASLFLNRNKNKK